MRWMSAPISAWRGERSTAEPACPRAVAPATPSMRSAAPLMVVMRPAESSESTPVATASSTVSV